MLTQYSYYPKNPKMQEINPKVDQLLEKECIEPQWRLCVDFRQINARSVKDAYPMPMVNYGI